MKRLRYICLGALLLIGLVVTLLVPETRYGIPGWLRGEQWFRGRPTCYWSAAVRSYVKARDNPPGPPFPFLARLLGIRPHYEWTAQPAVLGGGRESIPVLLQLLRDKDKNVRQAAAQSLGDLGTAGGIGVPALAAALQDPDPNVRWTAAFALYRIGPAAARAVPDEVLKQMGLDPRKVKP